MSRKEKKVWLGWREEAIWIEMALWERKGKDIFTYTPEFEPSDDVTKTQKS
jgi:hypothetical protein